MSDFPTYQPEPTEPRFYKLRVLLWHLWPLLLVFLVGLVAFVLIAFPGVLNRLMPAADLSDATAPAERTLDEDPPLGGTTSLWVDSEPVGAGVLVDGDSVGVTPMLVPAVSAGQRTVTVRAPGFARRDTTLDLQADLPAQLWLALQPSSPGLTTTAPGGAATPLAVDSPPPPPTPDAPPPPAATAATGRVEIAARPWGDIFINGTLVRSQTDVLYQADLPAGRHRVRVSHPALGSQERTVTVAPGGAQRLTFDLGPSADSAPE